MSGISPTVGSPYRPGVPPGVYEQLPSGAPRRVDVRMDTAAFVGLTERGPVCTPVAVESWGEFRARFGDDGGGRRLPRSVAQFFANGGRRCVVVRAVDYARARTARWTLPGLRWNDHADPESRSSLELFARDPGAWGNGLRARVEVTSRALGLPLRAGVGTPDEPDGPTLLWANADPGVPAGALLRFVRVDGPVEGPRTLEEALVFVLSVARLPDGRVRLDLRSPLAGGFRVEGPLGTAQEVRADLRVRRGDDVERFRDLGLHPLHPRWLGRILLEGEEPVPEQVQDPMFRAEGGSRLVRPVAVPAGLSDLGLLPAGSMLRPELPREWDAEQLLVAGTDAAGTTGREVFFRAPLALLSAGSVPPADVIADRAGPGRWHAVDRPAPFAALDDYDERNQAEPVTLVHLPDLLHVDGEWEQPPDETGSPAEAADDPRCFQPCGTTTPTAEPRRVALWPLLSLSDPDEVLDYQRELVDLCERRWTGGGDAPAVRVAVLTPPPGLTEGPLRAWRSRLASDRAAAYAPYLRVPPAGDPAGPLMSLAPGGAVCGLIARRTRTLGVHAPPAGERLLGLAGLREDRALPGPGPLHGLRVNAVRRTERGVELMGSRTTSLDPAWTHLNVRRVLDWLERQLPVDASWAVFEPNSPLLWRRLEQVVGRRLQSLYDAGGLLGKSPAEAFFVRCDAGTNPQSSLDEGRCTVLVGVAPAVPVEFLVFRLVLARDGSARVEVPGG